MIFNVFSVCVRVWGMCILDPHHKCMHNLISYFDDEPPILKPLLGKAACSRESSPSDVQKPYGALESHVFCSDIRDLEG